MQTFVSPLHPHGNAWHFVRRWHSPESARCGKCGRSMALWDIFFTVEDGGGKVPFFCQLKIKKTLTYNATPHKEYSSKDLYSLGCFDVLFSAGLCFLTVDRIGFARVLCVRKYALSAWSWISIPNPCVYPSLSFTSSLCCFAVQQLFGILCRTSASTLMLRSVLIWISRLYSTGGHSFSLLNVFLLPRIALRRHVDGDDGAELACGMRRAGGGAC